MSPEMDAGAATPPAGARVELGPVTVQDSEVMFRWFNDADAARTDFAWRPVDGLSHQKWLLALGGDPSQVWFTVRRAGQGGLLGYVVLSHISTTHRSCELGLRIGQEADRGQGLGREAARLAVLYCWQTLNLARIQVAVLADNPRALRLYAALGFRREGVLRRSLYIGGAWHDNVIMALRRKGAT